MKEKRKITSRAFADAKNIKAKAQKYNIQLAQIFDLKHHFDAETAEVDSLPAVVAAKTLTSMNTKSTKDIGPTIKILPKHFDHLKQYFEQLHEDGHAASVNILIVKLGHHDT